MRFQIPRAITVALFAAVAVNAIATQSAHAQPGPQRISESSSAVLRERCAVARGAFARDGRVTRGNAPIVKELRQCRESAGQVLPDAWRSAQPDSSELQTLLLASSSVRDSRITNTLETIVKDPAKDPLVRAAAASALGTLVFDGVQGFVRRSEIPGETWTVSVSLVTHLTQDDGLSVPDAGLKARLIQTFDGLAGTGARRTSFQMTLALLASYLRLS